MRHTLTSIGHTTEEHQIARLKVAEILGYLYALPCDGLLRGITRNNHVMLQQHRTHEATAIHAFHRGTCPDIGEAQQLLGSVENAFGIVLQPSTPLLQRLAIGLEQVALSSVRQCHGIEFTLLTQIAHTITCHHIADGLRLHVWLAIHHAIQGGHHYLLGTVPRLHLLQGHTVQGLGMCPSCIVVRTLNLVPSLEVQHPTGHTHLCLRHHLGIKVGCTSHVAYRDIHDGIVLAIGLLGKCLTKSQTGQHHES